MLALVVGGCINDKPLEGTLWELDSYMNSAGNLVTVLPDTEVTAQFENGQVKGSGGCNNYWGDYTVNGDAITIGLITKNQMYCFPDEINGQEEDYLAALQSATGYDISGSNLKMTNAGGDVVLIFTAA
jgi:heat shock protein HslJ